LITRQAISPRLAMRIFLNIGVLLFDLKRKVLDAAHKER